MTGFTISPASSKDANGIARVHVKTWQHAYNNQLPRTYLDSLSVEKRTETWSKNLENVDNKFKVFVAKTEERVVGFISICPCRDADMDTMTGELGAIYVDPEVMGQGIGSSLMEVGLKYLREQGSTRATLWVLVSNEKTRKWYESKGWKIEGKTKSEPRDGFDLNEIRYIINLYP